MEQFWSMTYLEPRCKNCDSRIDYDVTTCWNDELGCHICLKCQKPLELKNQD